MNGLRLCRFEDPAEFRDRVEAWLLQREAEHNILLGVLPGLVAGTYPLDGAPYLVTMEVLDQVVGCAFRTPPFHLGVTRLPSGAIELLARDVAGVYDDLSGVIGPPADAAAVARAWAAIRGGEVRVSMRQGIYELRELQMPAQMAEGDARIATPDDGELLRAWGEAFVRETGIPAHDVHGLTDRFIAAGEVMLWEQSGTSQCMAVATGPTPHGVRIGFVYTPPEHRGHGVASALVAKLSQAQFDAGRSFCFLYTDLTNPTSNRIYQRLGYEQVARSVEVVIER